ncbi:MAG: hypothetical protein N3A55_09515 [Methylohalobius sp.]|nr:hypothetical protein [Methylohalobius sp.]
MRWLIPDAALVRKGRLAYGLSGALLIALALVVPFLPGLLGDKIPPIGFVGSVQLWLLLWGMWACLGARALSYQLGLSEEALWLRYQTGQAMRISKSEVLTDGKALLARSVWIPLGVKFRHRPWAALYRQEELQEIASCFRHVGRFELFIAGLRAKSVVCWTQVGAWIAAGALVGASLWLCLRSVAGC